MRAALLLEAAWWLFLGWLYAGDLVLWVQAERAPVAALGALPSLPLSLLGTALALAGVGLFAWARLRAVPARWRPRRLALGASLAFALLDLGLISSRTGTVGAPQQLVYAVNGLASGLSDRAAPEGVPRDPALLEQLASELGPVPLFVDGERVPRWRVQLRERCQGPATSVDGAAPGTLVYCVRGDRRHAWVSVVALPLGAHFGTAELLGTTAPAVAEVGVPAAEPPRGLDEAPVWGEPTPPEE